MAHPAPFDPAAHVGCLARLPVGKPLRLLCDTNVYLDAREIIGYSDDGRLRFVFQPAAEAPPVALLRSTGIGALRLEFVIAQTVLKELYHLLLAGYKQCPDGLGDGLKVAAALGDLKRLHRPDLVQLGTNVDPEPLPDPPLSADERNDRRIWGEALRSQSRLITSDRALKEAVRLTTGDDCSALSPADLRDLMDTYLESVA